MKLEVGKEYNLNNVKEIKTTKDFLTLDKYVIGCQNVESINECRSREYVDTLLKMCGCLPFGLIDLDQVTKHFEIPNIFDIHVILFYYTTLAVQIALWQSVISLRKITYQTTKIFYSK